MPKGFDFAFKNDFEEDIEKIKVANIVRKNIANKLYDEKYLDICFQNYNGSIQHHDYYAFALFWEMLHSGQIVLSEYVINDECGSDKELHYNNKIMEPLSEYYEYEFTGGNYHSDGYIKMKKDIILKIQTICKDCNRIDNIELKDILYTLEVGYTRSTTTLYHLYTGESLARIPYGYKKIFFITQRIKYLSYEYEKIIKNKEIILPCDDIISRRLKLTKKI